MEFHKIDSRKSMKKKRNDHSGGTANRLTASG
jgi:hypothetical protein